MQPATFGAVTHDAFCQQLLWLLRRVSPDPAEPVTKPLRQPQPA